MFSKTLYTWTWQLDIYAQIYEVLCVHKQDMYISPFKNLKISTEGDISILSAALHLIPNISNNITNIQAGLILENKGMCAV